MGLPARGLHLLTYTKEGKAVTDCLFTCFLKCYGNDIEFRTNFRKSLTLFVVKSLTGRVKQVLKALFSESGCLLLLEVVFLSEMRLNQNSCITEVKQK